MELVVLVLSLLLAWPVCFLTGALVVAAASAYVIDPPAGLLQERLTEAVRLRCADGMQELSEAADAQLAQLIQRYDRPPGVAASETVDAALAAFVGQAQSLDFVEGLRATRAQHHDDLLAAMAELSAESKLVDDLVFSWRWWERVETLRLRWRGLRDFGPQIARHVVGLALTVTATTTLVAVVGSLFVWLFIPTTKGRGVPLLDFAGGAADVGLLVGLVMTAVLVFRRFWTPLTTAASPDERRAMRLGLTLGLMAFPINGVVQNRGWLADAQSWLIERAPRPGEGAASPTIVLIVIALYLAWRAIAWLRTARTRSGLSLARRLDNAATGLFGLTMAAAFLVVAPAVSAGPTGGDPLPALVPVVLIGFSAAALAVLAARAAAEVDERRRLARYRDAGLIVRPVRGPVLVGLLWFLCFVVLAALVDLSSSVSGAAPGWLHLPLTLVQVAVALAAVGAMFGGPFLVWRAARRRRARDDLLAEAYFDLKQATSRPQSGEDERPVE